ncbi:Protein of unknown function [Haloechinothrix alba]|uniref:DUF3558 domain-containing protein n=1 Tax=Haloechinothrix alba TaxID=664784 RepID=A0A238YDT6_9PSEU|nr:DUF3558 family protein [Haloechinothrix alba]SNR68764.1 Protein of unknown function [Haloechinothrix alba]
MCGSRTRFAQLFVGATAFVLLVACAQSSDGNPSAEPAGDENREQNRPSEPDKAAEVFAGVESCDLLDDVLRGEDFPPGEESTAGGENACQSSKSEFAAVGLNLQSDYAYDELSYAPEKIFPGDVNDRPANQVREAIGAEGSCDVSLHVEPNSRAIVSVSLRESDTDEACAFVEELAERLEPMLPGDAG